MKVGRDIAEPLDQRFFPNLGIIIPLKRLILLIGWITVLISILNLFDL
ncbi:MAG: hypothetical protein R6U96_19180 [Promethearchaeia archaeon]